MSKKKRTIQVISENEIHQSIHIIRGTKVMLDKDLAKLYIVDTAALNRAVKRNMESFPPEFLFKLTTQEFSNLKCQFGTSSWGGTRKPPFAFTYDGISMLASVLRSKIARQRTVFIMKSFGKTQQLLTENEQLRKQLHILAKNVYGNSEKINVAFDAINFLLDDRKKNSKSL
jgi:ORF6N domain